MHHNVNVYSYETAHLNMVKMVNFMSCIFYHTQHTHKTTLVSPEIFKKLCKPIYGWYFENQQGRGIIYTHDPVINLLIQNLDCFEGPGPVLVSVKQGRMKN